MNKKLKSQTIGKAKISKNLLLYFKYKIVIYDFKLLIKFKTPDTINKTDLPINLIIDR